MSGDTAHEFVDTNVLVYAHDKSAGDKHTKASALVARLWSAGGGSVSVQVLQEFFVTVTRKGPRPLDSPTAEAIVRDLTAWAVFSPAADDVLAAIQIHRKQKISFWDAMILRSAAELGCDTIWSEDLNAGQEYDGVTVRNPFA